MLGGELRRQLVGHDVRHVPALLAIRILAIPPKARMQPEKGEDADQQRDHGLGGDPDFRILGEIVAVAVRTEAEEAGSRQGRFVLLAAVALLAGLQPVLLVHFRFRIFRRLDGMAAMTVRAFGGIGIAQPVHLAVVGGLVGLVGILVAIAATGGDRQLGLVGGTADDVVGGVAIGADRGLDILLLGGLPAVRRSGPVFQVVLMAFAADIGHGEVPVLALLRSAQRHIEGMHVVAVAADGVQPGRLVLVRFGVEGFPVGRDVFRDDAQAGLLRGFVVLPGGFPQIQVALGAIDLRRAGHLLVRRYVVDDFLVAGDTLHFGVHALAIFVRIDCVQLALLAIGLWHLQFALLAVVAGLAGGVVELLRQGRGRGVGRRDNAAGKRSGQAD
jgi:hypothetical protein